MSKVHLHGAGHGPGHTHAEDDEHGAGDGGDTGGDGGDGGHGGGGAPGTTRTRARWTGRLELIITVLLGLTAVVGAFAALKNEQRNHDATFEFSEGIKNFDDEARKEQDKAITSRWSR
ncbi:MAG: hypothetical protein ACJ76X_17075 [Solirubrobacteraceae bacterium]|jgi:hypothetical protein